MRDIEPEAATPIHDATVEARLAAARRVSRQFGRRIARKATKFAAKRDASHAQDLMLKAFRKARRLESLPHQGPSPTVVRVRGLNPQKKGAPFRRVLTLTEMPNGDDVPAGCEATFHTTKGLRVVRGCFY